MCRDIRRKHAADRRVVMCVKTRGITEIRWTTAVEPIQRAWEKKDNDGRTGEGRLEDSRGWVAKDEPESERAGWRRESQVRWQSPGGLSTAETLVSEPSERAVSWWTVGC